MFTLLTFEKHLVITLRLKSHRLNSSVVWVLFWCYGTLNSWWVWVIPSYLLPNVPDIFMAHCVQSSFLNSIQMQRARWRRWRCLTFYGGFVISYLFSGGWRLMEKEGKLRGQCQNMKAILTLHKILKGRILFLCWRITLALIILQLPIFPWFLYEFLVTFSDILLNSVLATESRR